jgi:mutator protein MutT
MRAAVQRVVDVAAALIFRDGRLLITRRNAGAHLGGLWEFPGGKREPGETFRSCLKRELREELGIEIATLRLVATVRHDYPDKKVRLKFYLCRLLKNEPRPLECAAVAWVRRPELQHYKFPEADAQLLDKIRGTSAFWSSSVIKRRRSGKN